MERWISSMGLGVLVFVSSVALAGCHFSTGEEGFICESSDECNEGLRCYTFTAEDGDTRGQCEAPSTTEVTQGYRTGGVWLSWGSVIGFPILLIAYFIWNYRDKKRQAAAGTPPAGAPPPA